MRIHFTPVKTGRPKQPVKLSDYQKQIVLLIAAGNTMQMAALKLKTSMFSVNSSLRYLLRKYSVNNSITLIIKLHQLGEINLNDIQILKRDFNNAA